jgi:hypothetical protein
MRLRAEVDEAADQVVSADSKGWRCRDGWCRRPGFGRRESEGAVRPMGVVMGGELGEYSL